MTQVKYIRKFILSIYSKHSTLQKTKNIYHHINNIQPYINYILQISFFIIAIIPLNIKISNIFYMIELLKIKFFIIIYNKTYFYHIIIPLTITSKGYFVHHSFISLIISFVYAFIIYGFCFPKT